MIKIKFPVSTKIDFIFIFAALFLLLLALYIYNYIGNRFTATDQTASLLQIKNKITEIDTRLGKLQQTLNETHNARLNNAMWFYSEQQLLIDNDIVELKHISRNYSEPEFELYSFQTQLAEYYKNIESDKQPQQVNKVQLTNRNLLYEKVHASLANMKITVDQKINKNYKSIAVAKGKDSSVAIIIAITSLLILSGLYLILKHYTKQNSKQEKELKNKIEELEQINKNNKRQFSVIAHDLRGPFHPILMISEILMTGGDEIDRKEIIELGRKLKTTGESVLSLLDNLLVWSRARSGTLHLKSELFSLRDTVSQAFANLKMEAEKKEISDINEVSENLWIISDHNILLLLLQNLISNAIKFTNKGGKVRVTGKMENNNILVSVIDNGIGMTAEIAGSIFNSGLNHSTLGTNNEKGSGMGLIFCKEYVELHNGKIWVESKPALGSTFSFTIPAKALSQNGDLFTCYKVKPSTKTRAGENLISVRV
jgi:signal transduction histidine kinase